MSRKKINQKVIITMKNNHQFTGKITGWVYKVKPDFSNIELYVTKEQIKNS